ncbi:MAG: hypothetical protein DWQ07_16840 [Chloroflexi bacterium]|nr:MAG: hypothetical protein DWQ07_16840 [Chloroflexota bacterium]MBL1195415.1 hypothetical protein [Chloroflexota bacterium]
MRLLRIQSGEGSLVFVLGFVLLINSIAMQIAGIVSVSGFLNAGGVNQILLILFIDYALIMLLGGLQSLIVDRFDRVKLIRWATLAFAVIFLVLRVMFWIGAPDWLNYSLMYLIAEQQYVLYPLIFWVLANDIFKLDQSKRLFPVISSWNFVGKLLGIGIAAISPSIFLALGIPLEEILLINIVIYLVAYVLITMGLRNVDIRKTVQQSEPIRKTLREGWDFMTDVPSFRFMMYAILFLAVADTIIEFRFLVVSDAIFTTQASYQQFFSLYRLGVTVVALGIQAFITSRMITAMELKNTFFIFPAAALIGAIGMILLPGLSMAVIAMVTVKLVRDTVDESGRKSFQGLVPEERRGRVSTMMESYLPSVGTMLACVVAGAIVIIGLVQNRDMSIVYLAVAVLASIGAFWAILRLRSVYESSLLSWRLKRRQRRTDSVLLKKLES